MFIATIAAPKLFSKIPATRRFTKTPPTKEERQISAMKEDVQNMYDIDIIRNYKVNGIVWVLIDAWVDFPVRESSRRAGDPPSLVADSSKIKQKFNWKPRHDDLGSIVKTAWDREKKIRSSSFGVESPEYQT